MNNLPTISAIIMGKNELNYFLKEAISSANKFVDEIVYIDTGSNDGSVEWISENYPKVKCFYHKWTGWETSNIIRNFAISKCSCDYIVAYDCDEVFGKDVFKIKEILKKYPDVESFSYQGVHYMYDMCHVDTSVKEHIWLNRIFKNNGKLLYPENQHGLVNAETNLILKGDFIHHYGNCKNIPLALRRYDQNTGDKNEFQDKRSREDYLSWQLLTLLTGAYPRKTCSMLNHPDEIKNNYHMEHLISWTEQHKENFDKTTWNRWLKKCIE